LAGNESASTAVLSFVMAIPIGILDQSPIVSGSTPAEAVAASIALARHAEQLGYHRFWLAEHHAMGGLADASPEILLARLTAETSRIRLGTGGVMLPHYSALKVAETFRMLEALAPGRIDLGIGRAPGGTHLVSTALETGDVNRFPQQIADTIDFLDGTMPERSPFAPLKAMPTGGTSPDVWMLGSSQYGALLAAEMGLPYTYAHFIGGDAPAIVRTYRERFKPSRRCAEPRAIVALAAIAAPTAGPSRSGDSGSFAASPVPCPRLGKQPAIRGRRSNGAKSPQRGESSPARRMTFARKSKRRSQNMAPTKR